MKINLNYILRYKKKNYINIIDLVYWSLYKMKGNSWNNYNKTEGFILTITKTIIKKLNKNKKYLKW
jgi:hypothetical protein